MGTLVSINGKIVSANDATVSVFDRGFLYGDSVFETVRTYGGKPFALHKHLERLERSAALVFIDVPVTRSELTAEIEELVAQAGNEESYLRIIVTRGQGELGLDPSAAVSANRVVITAPLHPPAPQLYQSGIKVITFRTQRATDAVGAEGAKVGNYLSSVLAMREAKKVGALEALIVDAKGRVIEGATSNLFWLQGGTLFTPPLEVGILAGITRAYVLEAAKSLQRPVQQLAPKLKELLSAEEVFISSSIRELLPVVAVDGKQIGTGSPGPITRELHQRFRQMVTERSS
ncbi:MAG TPA: aminotransferase class IV [Polyangiaceae bacterium]|jgi:branched-chain amino acid aminotransferase|nr:aminotransferase class IV [Polyangiaceae bacterium]